MNKLTATYIFECDINNFETSRNPIYLYNDSYEEKEEVLGSRKFEISLGDNITKWEFKNEITEYGINLCLKKEVSDSNNFSVRATCMIPKKIKDGIKNSMHYIHTTGTAKKFESGYEALNFLFEDIESGRYYRMSVLKMLVKIELIEGNFPQELSKYIDTDDLRSNFVDLYYCEDFSDFTIVCSGGEEFPVHRCILSVNSPVLKAMMLTEMQESIENKLEVNDIDGRVMDTILFFMYTQRIDGIAEQLEGLLYGAEKYQVKSLKGICIGHMFDTLSVETSVEYFMLASLYDIDRLKQLCLMYIQTYHEDLRKTEEWEELSAQQLEMIEQHIKEYDARVIDKHELPEYFWYR